ncbi:MAG: tRNA (adenosine(37)-N6)-threonylcarbamoyltransferase complex ATPase subunit type 1 TsaE [Actinomycetota bacterium]|nr:tRNA (adenosine(37)-N6)-threonylcarbamoyltransferase complex ATPase subunit type 1 TsaE [Actinomycetota bacterium]
MGRVLTVTTSSPEETRILGASLAPALLPGDVVSLTGDLGAGKTAFVQGLASALGVKTRVTSPSFTIIHTYQGQFPLVHMDVYRLDSFQEVIDLGFDELIDPEAILVVEWGEAVAPLLPTRYLEIELRQPLGPEPENVRHVFMRPHGAEWLRKLDAMQRTAETLLDAATPGVTEGGRFLDSSALLARDHGDRPAEPDEEV